MSKGTPPSSLFQVVDTIHTNTVTTVRLLVNVAGTNLNETFTVVGVARRHPNDKDRPSYGVALATSRALQTAGRRLERRIQGYVKHTDDIEVVKTTTPPTRKQANRRAAAKRQAVATVAS